MIKFSFVFLKCTQIWKLNVQQNMLLLNSKQWSDNQKKSPGHKEKSVTGWLMKSQCCESLWKEKYRCLQFLIGTACSGLGLGPTQPTIPPGQVCCPEAPYLPLGLWGVGIVLLHLATRFQTHQPILGACSCNGATSHWFLCCLCGHSLESCSGRIWVFSPDGVSVYADVLLT